MLSSLSTLATRTSLQLRTLPRLRIGTNGVTYEGEWKDGKYHGEGTVTFANGSSFTREWVNGELQELVNQR